MSAAPMPPADAVCEGGDLDCGIGLLLIIREALDPLSEGGVLEIRSSEISVKEDLPAWCRMVGHALVGTRPSAGRSISYFVRKAQSDSSLDSDLKTAAEFRWQVRAAASPTGATRVFARNHSFEIGQPASFDTADAAPSAIEFLLGALAADLVAGLRWRASRVGIELEQLEFSLSARAADPRVFLGLVDGGNAALGDIAGRMYVQSTAGIEQLAELWRETTSRSLIASTLAKGTQLNLELKAMP
jgi:TusA-related sulfurtransferase